MNLLEKYVYNITSVKEIKYDGKYDDIVLYELICDTDCYGDIRKQVTVLLTKSEYDMVKEKGYYMC